MQIILILALIYLIILCFNATKHFYKRSCNKLSPEKKKEKSFNTANKIAITSSHNFLDVLLPLCLKIAFFDKNFHANENKVIEDFFITNLGFDRDFVISKIGFTIPKVSDFSISDLAKNLSKYINEVAPAELSDDILLDVYDFLNIIIEADGKIDETELLAIKEVAKCFNIPD